MEAPACGRCGGAMERGYVPEAHEYTAAVDTWVEGAPERSWLGLTLRTHGKRRLEIATWRCTACGYLESYAPGADQV